MLRVIVTINNAPADPGTNEYRIPEDWRVYCTRTRLLVFIL